MKIVSVVFCKAVDKEVVLVRKKGEGQCEAFLLPVEVLCLRFLPISSLPILLWMTMSGV